MAIRKLLLPLTGTAAGEAALSTALAGTRLAGVPHNLRALRRWAAAPQSGLVPSI